MIETTTGKKSFSARWQCVYDNPGRPEHVRICRKKRGLFTSGVYGGDSRHGHSTTISETHSLIRLRTLAAILDDNPRLTRFIDMYRFRILGIADSVPGSGGALQGQYAAIEKTLLRESPIFSMGEYSIDLVWFERRNLEELQKKALLAKKRISMVELVRYLVPELHRNSGAVRFEIGPRKTEESMKRRVALDQDHTLLRFVHDILRCRVVCYDLRVLERICDQIYRKLAPKVCDRTFFETEIMPNSSGFPRLVRYRNHFTRSARKYATYPNPFRGINLTIAMDENHGFELQILTEHTHIAARPDHPFFVSRSRKFPDGQSQKWLVDFLWKVNIFDAQNYLKVVKQFCDRSCFS